MTNNVQSDLSALIQNFLTWNTPEKIQLDSYNYFINHSLPHILIDEMIETESVVLRITDVKVIRQNDLSPESCVLTATTYNAEIIATMVYHFKNSPHTTRNSIEVLLGKIPIMVGSQLCSLYKETKIMKCYFIVKGAKKVVCMEERIAYNYPFLLNKKKEFKFFKYVEFKSVNNLLRSSLVDIGAKITRQSKSRIVYNIVVYCPELTNKELLPIEFFLSLFLSLDDVKTGLSLIAKSVPLEYMASLTEIIIDNFSFSWEKEKVYNLIYSCNTKIKTERDLITTLKERYLLHMEKLSLKEKGIFTMYLLKILLFGLVEYIAVDDRDHYGNKRVYGINHFFSTELFHVFHKKYKKKIITSFDKSFIKPKVTEPDCIKRLLEKNQEITSSFQNCLTSNTWYGKTQSAQYVSQVFDPFNGINYIDLIRKINTPVKNDSNRILGPRDLHLTQSDILCPYGTPDGKKVGLIKYPSVQSVMSCDESLNMSDFVKQLIQEYILDMNLTLTPVLVNGHCIGTVKNTDYPHILKKLRSLKTNLRFFTTSIHFSKKINAIIIMSDAGRLLYPVVFSRQYLKEDFKEALIKGYILLIDKNELEELQLNEIDLLGNYKYVITEQHPFDFCFSFSLGYAGNMIPYSNHNQAPRNIYQCQMSKQAIGFLMPFDYPATYNQLLYPQTPLVGTLLQTLPFIYEHPAGINAFVAIMPLDGENQEDSVILNKGSLERGLFNSERTLAFKHVLDTSDILCAPSEEPSGTNYSYRNINSSGIVKKKAIIKKNDVLISVKRPASMKVEPVLIFQIEDCLMQVTDSRILLTEKKETIVTITATELLIPQIGDKFCLTPDHEVLTSTGWQFIDSITTDSIVACLNKNDTFSYKKVIETHCFDLNEQLCEITTPRISIKSTQNHRMLVKKPHSTKYQFLSAAKCMTERVVFKTTSLGIHHDSPKSSPSCAAKQSSPNAKLQLNVAERLPAWAFEMSSYETKKLLSQILKQQACTPKKYKQASRSCAYFDDLQRLAVHCGYSIYTDKQTQTYKKLILAKVSPILYTEQCKQTYDEISSQVKGYDETYTSSKFTHYSGKVYCLTVPGNVFCIRRRYKVMWTGNSSRHGQKGTVGMIYAQEDLPFTEAGINPDIVINPLCMPSRMTIGHLLEMASGIDVSEKSLNTYCEICVNYKKNPLNPRCTTDCFFKNTVKNYLHHTSFYKELIPQHVKEFKNTVMYCGKTGRMMDTLIYSGIVYYQRLKHMSRDKVYVRTTGPIQPITRQPKEGRSVEGGHRFGLQERDCILSHGCVYALRDRLFLNSDFYKLYICECGLIYHGKKPDKYGFACCKQCQSFNLFLVELPFASKVLIQMLLPFNIIMRLMPSPKN